jgi:hypothetical protein
MNTYIVKFVFLFYFFIFGEPVFQSYIDSQTKPQACICK